MSGIRIKIPTEKVKKIAKIRCYKMKYVEHGGIFFSGRNFVKGAEGNGILEKFLEQMAFAT